MSGDIQRVASDSYLVLRFLVGFAVGTRVGLLIEIKDQM